MPQGNASEYAALHARVRVMYSTLLTDSVRAGLYEATDFPALIRLLKETTYGPYLEKVDDKNLTPRRAVYQIKGQLANAYTTLIQLAPGHVRPLLRQLYRRYEVDNLKAVLRGIVTDATWDQVLFVLFPLGPTAAFSAEAMVETKNVSAAIELLRNTPYYATLSHAMERYTAEKSLFPLEVALDLDYWRKLWVEVNHLPSQDRAQAMRIVGSLLDMNNLMWAIRYREYHHLSEEEIINYTLPIGYRVHDEDIRAIAAGADISQLVNRIYPQIRGAIRLYQGPQGELPRLEAGFQRDIIQQCKAAFVGYPFHVGIPLAYLVLDELEIQDLTVLIEAKASQMPAEGFQPYLLLGPLPK